MRISEQAIQLLKELEGFRSAAYKDSAGVLTIGYGTTGDWITSQSKVTKEDADKLLRKHVLLCEAALSNNVKVSLDQNEFDALCCFIYNIGVQEFKESTLLELLNQAHYDKVPAQLRRWNKIKRNGIHVVDKGLVNRREKEIILWNQTPPTILQQTQNWLNNAFSLLKKIK